MKQIVQTLKDGEISIEDVPVPVMHDRFVLVRNAASVISAGTEKTKIDMGKKNLLQKARSRPDLVKQVLNKVRTEGLAKTIKTVQTRLESLSPLGYSSAGVVIAVGGLVEDMKPGDRVACAGAGYANHAELVAVPKNLIARIPDGVSDEEAAFTTVGSIALQGVRMAEPKMGERFLVVGLGLLGQITVQLLRANGCQVMGTDLDAFLVSLAEKFDALGSPPDDVVEACLNWTGGMGVDGVLICAGTPSNQPIEMAGEVTREKGRVIVLGAVRMDIPRSPYYEKEISIALSRSYGPGRYDPKYEESGIDYPFGYVRFTEQRNMQTFLMLLAEKRIDVSSLITHRFSIEQAQEAYTLLSGEKRQPYLGIVLSYGNNKLSDVRPESGAARVQIKPCAASSGSLGVSFIGAGNYTTATLLPLVKSFPNINLRGLLTASGRTAKGVADRFDFSFTTSKVEDLMADDTDMVMITTRHDTHASMVVKALEAGKHVYVEKPLALTVDELKKVRSANRADRGGQLMVGFNRRFAPLTTWVQHHFSNVRTPLMVNIRVNAGRVPADHWIQNPEVGGGRIIGEACHFVDLASALIGAEPVAVYVAGVHSEKPPLLEDNVIMNLRFANGGVAIIAYTSEGAKSMPKERIEVFGGGRSAYIDDFKSAILFEKDKVVGKRKLSAQDKGQKAMLQHWLSCLQKGQIAMEYSSLERVSLATIRAIESLMLDQLMPVDADLLNEWK